MNKLGNQSTVFNQTIRGHRNGQERPHSANRVGRIVQIYEQTVSSVMRELLPSDI